MELYFTKSFKDRVNGKLKINITYKGEIVGRNLKILLHRMQNNEHVKTTQKPLDNIWHIYKYDETRNK